MGSPNEERKGDELERIWKMMALAHHEYHKIKGICSVTCTLSFYCLTLHKASVNIEAVYVCSFV